MSRAGAYVSKRRKHPASKRSSATADRNMLEPIRILHLEDSELDADLIAARLAASGISCRFTRVWARDTFLEAIRDPCFDLILSDYSLPSFDGLTALAIAREQCPEIPFIIVSGVLGEDVAVDTLKRGATDYVLKSRLERLGSAIERALNEARQRAERREAEIALHASERRYEFVVNNLAEYAFILLDLDGTITDWSEGARELFGYHADEVIGRPFDLLYSEEDQEAGVPRRDLRDCADMGREEDERWRVRRNGSRFFSSGVLTAIRDDAGGVVGYVSILRDITERKEREEARLHHARQLQLLSRAAVAINSALSLEDLLQVVTDQARHIIEAHQSLTILTRDRDWTQGATCLSLSEKHTGADRRVPRAGVERVCQFICRSNRAMRFTQDELEANTEFQATISAGGLEAPIRGWLAAPMMRRDGTTIGMIQLTDKIEGEFSETDEAILVQLAHMASIAVENTQFYKAAQQARAESESAGRMKDQFLATLSHELRTPLNAILGWSQLLRQPDLDPETLAEGLEVIERHSRVQAQLIEDLLDVSRIITGKLRLDLEPVDLSEVIDAAITAIEPNVGAKRITIDYKPRPLSGVLHADSARLQQIIWNLLSNAVKFSPEGARIDVTTREAAAYVELIVKDHGAGIDPSFLPFVFERFHQADSSTTRRHGGLGLGLSIVRQLTEMHGGSVSVQSDGRGKGSSFHVRLPLQQPSIALLSVPRPSAPRSNPFQTPLNGVRVLIVDDERDARELLRRHLSDRGALVQPMGSVADALAALPEFRPNLLLTDIGMPDQDGYDLIRAVRNLPEPLCSVPAIALTAFAREEDRRKALLAGFQMHIAKPVNWDELFAAIAELLSRDAH